MTKLFHLSRRSRGSTLQLSAVILYNDAQLAHVAANQCTNIESFVPGAHVYTVRMVNLDSLADFGDPEKAATEARDADLIFLCMRPGTELNRWTKIWMREWASDRIRPGGAMIYLYRSQRGWRSAVLHDFYQTLAKLGDMELVLNEVAQPEELVLRREMVLS